MGLTGGALLPPALAVAVALGGWAVTTDLAPAPAPARVGEAVAVDGGQWKVEQVVPRTVGHAGPGSDPDPVPEGLRRVTLRLALAGGPDGLRRPADRLRLVVAGEEHAPHRSELQGEDVPEGSVLRGAVVFQVPRGSDRARVELRGADRAVVVDLPRAGEEHAGH